MKVLMVEQFLPDSVYTLELCRALRLHKDLRLTVFCRKGGPVPLDGVQWKDALYAGGRGKAEAVLRYGAGLAALAREMRTGGVDGVRTRTYEVTFVDGREVATTTTEVPDLEGFVGQDIVVTDGTTLLGADDKAGIAEIVALVARLMDDPTLPHPTLKIAFVPDEEIGHGAELLDIDAFGASWCYTVDGEALGEFNYECFSASEATVTVHGTMVHPGTAKNVMVNAITVLGEFDALVPATERPEHTEGREGFFHPTDVAGTASEASLTYIVRDFDAQKFAAREQLLRDVADFLNARYGAGTVEVKIRGQYRNMAEHLADKRFLIDNAMQANREAGIEPSIVAVRGGTDGAQLTFRGLPCPNIATGGYNAHSVREFVPVPSLEVTVDVLQNLVAKFAVPQQ